MNAWELITREPLAIQIHLVTVVPSFFLGTWLIFLSRKGSLFHRILGSIYLGVFSAIWRIRQKDVAGHRAAMLGVYFGGLVIAGSLTFLPGRLMYKLFFG